MLKEILKNIDIFRFIIISFFFVLFSRINLIYLYRIYKIVIRTLIYFEIGTGGFSKTISGH